jgi:ketosteroid isomerase-like protein
MFIGLMEHASLKAEANVELVRGLYPEGGLDWVDVFADRASEDDAVSRFGDLFHPDFEMVWSGARDAKPSRAGFAANRKALRDSMRAFSSFRIIPERFIGLGPRVLVYVRRHGRTHEGEEFSAEGAALFEIRDGMIYRLELFTSREDARRVAGL